MGGNEKIEIDFVFRWIAIDAEDVVQAIIMVESSKVL